MAKKIHAIKFQAMEIVLGENGEFIQKEVGPAEVKPLLLTNYALAKGRDLGLLESSLLADLVSVKQAKKTGNKEKDEQADKEMLLSLLDNMPEGKVLKILYVAYLGANKSSRVSYEDFLDKYQGSTSDALELCFNVLESALLSEKENKFAKGFQNSTSKKNRNTRRR